MALHRLMTPYFMHNLNNESGYIVGLKVALASEEVRELAGQRAQKARKRIKDMQDQRTALLESDALKLSHCNSDISPSEIFRNKIAEEEKTANEMEFLASHAPIGAKYLLNWEDLYRLGVVASRY